MADIFPINNKEKVLVSPSLSRLYAVSTHAQAQTSAFMKTIGQYNFVCNFFYK